MLNVYLHFPTSFLVWQGGWDQTIAAVIGVHVVVYAVLVQSFTPDADTKKAE